MTCVVLGKSSSSESETSTPWASGERLCVLVMFAVGANALEPRLSVRRFVGRGRGFVLDRWRTARASGLVRGSGGAKGSAFGEWKKVRRARRCGGRRRGAARLCRHACRPARNDVGRRAIFSVGPPTPSLRDAEAHPGAARRLSDGLQLSGAAPCASSRSATAPRLFEADGANPTGAEATGLERSGAATEATWWAESFPTSSTLRRSSTARAHRDEPMQRRGTALRGSCEPVGDRTRRSARRSRTTSASARAGCRPRAGTRGRSWFRWRRTTRTRRAGAERRDGGRDLVSAPRGART